VDGGLTAIVAYAASQNLLPVAGEDDLIRRGRLAMGHEHSERVVKGGGLLPDKAEEVGKARVPETVDVPLATKAL
jgi:hypothetical protein